MLPMNLLVSKRRWNFLSSSINLHANQLICYFPLAYLLYMHLSSSKTNPNPILSFWPYGRRSRRLHQNRITDSLIWCLRSVRRGNYICQKKAKRVVFSPDVISRFHYRFNDCFAHIQFFIRMFWISWCFFSLITFDILFL